jgi:integral membrane protein
MTTFLKTPLGRFRLIAFMEGVSFLLLLFIAMPLKYLFGYHLAVKYVGWLHGLLFVLYALTLLPLRFSERWSFGRMIYAMFLSFIPFGTFILEKKLREQANS